MLTDQMDDIYEHDVCIDGNHQHASITINYLIITTMEHRIDFKCLFCVLFYFRFLCILTLPAAYGCFFSFCLSIFI